MDGHRGIELVPALARAAIAEMVEVVTPKRPRRIRGEGSFGQRHLPTCPPANKKGERPKHACDGPDAPSESALYRQVCEIIAATYGRWVQDRTWTGEGKRSVWIPLRCRDVMPTAPHGAMANQRLGDGPLGPQFLQPS